MPVISIGGVIPPCSIQPFFGPEIEAWIYASFGVGVALGLIIGVTAITVLRKKKVNKKG